MRTINKIIDAVYSPIADLITYSPLPAESLNQIDPFLLLNHHGPQKYPSNNNGLPFGPHPHRGMETVTFIIDGDIMHKDSSGNESVITAGGVQWMTAGSGLIHAEVSSSEFKKKGGNLEILQLWVNLPAKQKMTKPFYKGLQSDEIPNIKYTNGSIKVISGKHEKTDGAFTSINNVHLSLINFFADSELQLEVPVDENILFYIINGDLKVNNKNADARQLVQFNNDSEKISIEIIEDSLILFGHAKPFNEPVVAQGPFVMNSREEIAEAYYDYRSGKFGTWKD